VTIEQQIRALAAAGHSDPAIGDALGITRHAVRSWRRRCDIPAGVPPGGSSLATGWEQRLTALWEQEPPLTTAELAEAMGWTHRTTQERMHQLGLPAHRGRILTGTGQETDDS
jgi:hypothetical protein